MIKIILDKAKEFLNAVPAQRTKYFTNPDKDFTRNRDLGYKEVAYMLINLSRKSLAVELEDFFERTKSAQVSVSAFSQARQKLLPNLFKDWSSVLHANYYELCQKEVKTWNGFKLFGIDGSKAYLFNTPQVIEEFGANTNQHGQTAMANFSIAYDVLNQFCVYANIGRYTDSETNLLLPWLPSVPANSLLLFDRLYASFMLIYILQQANIQFVMRCKLGFNQVVKDFVASGQNEAIVEMSVNPKVYRDLKKMGYPLRSTELVKVRLVRVLLNSGEIEVLITSLLDSQIYPHEIFKELYAKRWGVETAYDHLKNQCQIELFSGKTPFTIRQDFFATIFTYNLQTLIIRSVDEQVDQINQKRKHNYQINRNVSLGILKGRIITLFFDDANYHLLTFLQTRFVKHLTIDSKASGQNKPRNKRAQRILGKYRTLGNYKRAI